MKKTQFNIILCGVGGQGIITLLQILTEAALIEGYDVKSSELHGLSQRGGMVVTHLRFGEKIFSPMILPGKANLILGLEISEALRKIDFSNEKTIFLVNKKYIPYPNCLPEEKILKELKKIKNLYLIEASKICQEKLKNEVLAGIYLISFASFKNLIPLKPSSLKKAIKKIIPQKYLEQNLKALNLAKTA
jgi:indolepyruvate ferredoxin oxidoreductase beta subunit